MAFLALFDWGDFQDSLLSYLLALLLGAAIGFERQVRQSISSLRMNALVALGAAAFTDIAIALSNGDGGTRVISYVVSGLGFLGGGVIMREGANVRGLNTAATVWCTGAVGCAAGADHAAEALVLTLLVIGTNLFLRPIANFLRRRSGSAPLPPEEPTTHFDIHLVCRAAAAADIRADLVGRLAQASIVVNRIASRRTGATDQAELTATVTAPQSNADAVERIVAAIADDAGVQGAQWQAAAG